jgi:DNA (cytosine-5)-methyltransferase 1
VPQLRARLVGQAEARIKRRPPAEGSETVTLVLRIKDPQHFRKRRTGQGPTRSINLDIEPCPAIMADGIRSVTRQQYHLEDDGRPFVPDNAKPPYLIPTMAEVAAVPLTGFKVASTFAGAGGSSLGYRMEGFKVVYASEFVPAARAVYAANAAEGTAIDDRDIREVDPAGVLELLGMKPGDLDVLDGSPPCASFSMAGNREADWRAVKKYSDVEQRTDDLFFEYVRFLRVMRPRVFVAENVSGLVKGTAKGIFIKVFEAMRACGYRVGAQMLDAQWLGVPQARQRLIFVGVREDLGLEPAFPTPLPYRYSVRDALPWIKRQGDNGPFGKGQMRAALVPSPTIGAGPSSGNGKASPAFVEDAAGARKFTIEELKAICSFPADFRMSGDFSKDWERLGRAVPPLMMRAIAREVRGILERASGRTPAPALRSRGRSTTATLPRDAARTRTRRPNAART